MNPSTLHHGTTLYGSDLPCAACQQAQQLQGCRCPKPLAPTQCLSHGRAVVLGHLTLGSDFWHVLHCHLAHTVTAHEAFLTPSTAFLGPQALLAGLEVHAALSLATAT